MIGPSRVEDYLTNKAPADSSALEEVARRAYSNILLWSDVNPDWVKIGEAVLAGMKEYWQPRSGASTEAIEEAVKACVHWREERAAAKKAEEARQRRAEAAKERAERNAKWEAEERKAREKKERAEHIEMVQKEFGVGYRRAFDLLEPECTTLADYAERLARITGKKATYFYRPPGRPGPRGDYLKPFMTRRFAVTTFRVFTESDRAEFQIQGQALEAFEAITAERVDFEDHKDFSNFTRNLGINGDHAASVWREFERYCIRTISALALKQVQEEEEREMDFG